MNIYGKDSSLTVYVHMWNKTYDYNNGTPGGALLGIFCGGEPSGTYPFSIPYVRSGN